MLTVVFLLLNKENKRAGIKRSNIKVTFWIYFFKKVEIDLIF